VMALPTGPLRTRAVAERVGASEAISDEGLEFADACDSNE
jgi:hypothetical protein